jgi:hypothetical protein
MGRVQDVDTKAKKDFCFILHRALANLISLTRRGRVSHRVHGAVPTFSGLAMQIIQGRNQEFFTHALRPSSWRSLEPALYDALSMSLSSSSFHMTIDSCFARH